MSPIRGTHDGAMMRALTNDPDHWRQRAAESRAVAEQMVDGPAKEAMLKVADGYDYLALRAEQRSLTGTPGKPKPKADDATRT